MIIYSAHTGINSEIFPNILNLYVPKGSKIADVTYGKGVFWRQVELNDYTLLATDLKDGIDMKKLPYDETSIDCLVMDPPYMPTQYTGIQQFSDYYGIEREFKKDKWAKGVLELYYSGMKEATRVLTAKGVLIVKCQDMVCANQQVLVHVDLIKYAESLDWRCEDIFILVQSNKRPHPRKRQIHARKNHSYFLVFLRVGKKWN